MIDNKITIKGDQLVDIQRGAIGHRAIWMGLIYTKAKEAGWAEQAEKIIREAVSETGKVQGTALKAQCSDPESVACFIETFLTPNNSKTFEVELKSKSEDRVDIEFNHCPLLKGWQDLGFDDETCKKLCDMAMDGDRSIAKAMGYEFNLGGTIANGCKVCEMAYFKNNK